MTQLGARPISDAPRLVGTSYNDKVQELQEFLDQMKALADVTNTFLDEITINEGGGTVTVDVGGDAFANQFLLMGA